MRFYIGIIVGVILTIGVAYLFDASISGSFNALTQANAEQRTIVNWDVVGRDWQNLSSGVRNTLNKLATR